MTVLLLLLQVSKLQKEIDEESENKRDLVKAEEETIDLAHKALLRNQIEKSEEKVEALMMMMLHHCAGLQYCLDQEQEEKQRKASSDMPSASIDKNTKQPLKETKSSDSNLGKSLNKAEVQMVCPAISVEVASSPEENVEDFTLFPEKEDDSMHMEDPSNMSQDSEDSDQIRRRMKCLSQQSMKKKRIKVAYCLSNSLGHMLMRKTFWLMSSTLSLKSLKSQRGKQTPVTLRTPSPIPFSKVIHFLKEKKYHWFFSLKHIQYICPFAVFFF